MRLAIFTFEDGRKMAMLPTKVCIFEAGKPGDTDGPLVARLQADDDDTPFTVQGTFEEVVAEVNKALAISVQDIQQADSSRSGLCTYPGCNEPALSQSIANLGYFWCKKHLTKVQEETPITESPEKTGKCIDCGESVLDHQMRCAVCYRKEIDKPVNADDETDNPMPLRPYQCPACDSEYTTTDMNLRTGEPVRIICDRCSTVLWETK